MNEPRIVAPATYTLQQAARRALQSATDRGFRLEAIHTFSDADGRTLFWRLRAKHPATGEKYIRPLMHTAHGYVLKEPALPDGKPLYRLADLGTQPHAVVLVVEGELCADALHALGLLATTSGGMSSAARTDWQPLAGRNVLIWPDNDAAGQQYGEDVASILKAIDCTVDVIDVAALALPDKGDCVDWLAANPHAIAADVLALPTQPRHGAPLPVAVTVFAGNSTAPPTSWPTPTPLTTQLEPVPELEPALLPASLSDWLCDVADRIQCPLAFVAVPALVALGSVIGRQVGIRPQARTDWTETANLWGCIVGRPGCMKSPALSAALAPIERLAAQARATYETAHRQADIRRFEAELKATAIKDNARRAMRAGRALDLAELLNIDSSVEPVERRYVTHDSTYQALAEILIANPNGVLVVRDELVSLLANLDAEENADARGFFLTGWNGNAPYAVDRVTRGMNRRVRAVCLSVMGATQPGRLAAYVRAAHQGGARDEGLMQRFGMLVWPDQHGEWRNVDRWPDSTARLLAHVVFERAANLGTRAMGAESDGEGADEQTIPYLRLAPDALESFTAWRGNLEHALRDEHLSPAVESHFAKYRKLVPALALIFHVAEGATGPVSLAATEMAIRWASFLKAHALRVYASGPSTEMVAAKRLLSHIRLGALGDEFAARDVYRKRWSGLAERNIVTDALAVLEEHEYLVASTVPTQGRYATRYRVNPNVATGRTRGSQ